MILGTAGHIDHGKTTLVRALTGVDTDRLPEERRRGITIELGFAPLVLDGVGTIGVVDVPGHEAFVRTMVAGATGIDLALVVIAADEGVMPQTREHLAILQLLGVRAGVIALTKTDLVDDDWLALVEDDVRAATFAALPNAPIVPTSAQTGRGIEALRDALGAVARSIPARAGGDLFRLPIDRVFTIKGTGTVVTGTVWSGRLTRDDSVRILPGTRVARVRAIQGHGVQLDAAQPGARTAVALSGVEVADVPHGSTLVTDKGWRPTSLARADVTLVPGVDLAIRPRTWFRLHVGTSDVGVRIVARDAGTSGAFAARLVLDEPVLLRAGDRFVVRSSAPLNTIAGGVITDPYAPRRARPWRPGLSSEQRLDALVSEAGAEGLDVTTLPIRLGASAAECRRLLESTAERFVVMASRWVVAASTFAALRAQLIAAVERYHVDHPLETGIPTQGLRDSVRGGDEIVESALTTELESGGLISSSGAILLAGWSPRPTVEQAVLLETLFSVLEQADSEPPSLEELSAGSNDDVAACLRYLERTGRVVQVEANRYYAADRLEALVERLRSAMAGGGEVGPSELREALGMSRKYLIPLLEYCDRVGYTTRQATGRVWRRS